MDNHGCSARPISAGISLILNRVFSVDRYGLAREFELRKFEMTVMQMKDLYQVQELAVRLYSQTLALKQVYESMLAIRGHRPPKR